MNDSDAQRLTELLTEIRDDQRLQLQRQAEALAVQREQAEIAKRQFERAEKIQQRAEAIQDRSSQMITAARRIVLVVVPVLIVLIVYVSWLLRSEEHTSELQSRRDLVCRLLLE